MLHAVKKKELPFYPLIDVDATCNVCRKKIREELDRVTKEALLEMDQGELEEWMDPNDPDGTFKRLSDLIRNSLRRPRGSVGALLAADDLGVCPYCSQESCNHQCWTKRGEVIGAMMRLRIMPDHSMRMA